MNKKGTLVISLDYEMMWGCCDWTTPEAYGQTNIKQVPYVISRITKLFHLYGIHATIATVGMIMLKDKDDVMRNVPKKTPSYNNITVSPYRDNYIRDISPEHNQLYFAPEQVSKLNSDPNLEVGTHTYSHYFCLEQGQTIDEFEADLQKAIETATNLGITLKSIVFPKNQVSDRYLAVCAKYGITSYRGNAMKFFGEPKNRWESIRNRICRLLDAYINVGGMTSIPYDRLGRKEGMLNVCASRMLRPYSPKLFFLESLRLRRIRKEMIYAAKKGEMYHLWWHPHNFGANIEENLRFLENVLQTYKECKECYGMQSCMMNEIAEQIL